MDPLRSVEGIVTGIERRTLTAGHVVDLALARIAQTQPVHNAFITIDADRARRKAAELDRMIARGDAVGPLAGVPVAIKDVFDVAGLPTTAGSALFAGNIAATDGAAAAALLRAGAIIVGKTNMDEFAFGPNQAAFGRTNCPADPERYAGGSSAGSAAAVAAGCVPVALGSDAGGSVRYPAACCGVAGYKPSFHRYGIQGAIPSLRSLDHLGILGVGVDDVIRVDAALRDEPMQVETVRTPLLFGVPRGWQRLCSAEVVAAVEAALATLTSAGATHVAVEPIDEPAVFDALLTIVCAEAAASLDGLLTEEQYAEVAPAIRALVARGRSNSAAAYVGAQRYRDGLRTDVDRQLAGVDALLMPSTATVAKRWDGPDLDDWSIARFLPAFNLTGHPAISLPIPVEGLPVGIQIVGPRDADESLLAIAAWIETCVDKSHHS